MTAAADEIVAALKKAAEEWNRALLDAGLGFRVSGSFARFRATEGAASDGLKIQLDDLTERQLRDLAEFGDRLAELAGAELTMRIAGPPPH